MAHSATTASRVHGNLSRSGAKSKTILAFGTLLSAFAFGQILIESEPHPFVAVASLGAIVAFAIYTYIEAKSWRHPLTQRLGLNQVLWWAVAFPMYLVTTHHRRPFWLTTLLVLVPAAIAVATLYAFVLAR